MSHSMVPCGLVVLAVLALSLACADAAEAPPTGVGQAAPLHVGAVTADRQEAPLYEPVEFTVDLQATYDNPFDPDQIALDAEFHTPSGKTERLTGFYYQGFDAAYPGGRETLTPHGPPAWKVRYAPREVGDYSVTVRARDRSGEASAGPVTFRCVAGRSEGFARISTAPAGAPAAVPKYFRLDSGRSLFLIGHNVTSYAPDADKTFDKMAAGGENYTRYWMCSWGLGLEWGLPVGRYRMNEAWRLDRLLKLAKERGIRLMLCFDTHQDFINDGWPRNPYNKARGGPCAAPLDYFTDQQARDLYHKRLRYIVARWGYHPNVLAWEFGNEMEGWPGSQENRQAVASWHAEMGRALADLDPFHHPITSSLWTTEGWPELWKLPEMQFVQSHFYANNRWADMAGAVAAICRQKLRDYPDKLHLFGEYGILAGSGTAAQDPTGVHLHNGNWAALMSGSASNPVSWWHGEYIDRLDLYHVYRGLAEFVHDEDMAGSTGRSGGAGGAGRTGRSGGTGGAARTWRLLDDAPVRYVTAPQAPSYRDVEFSGTASGWDRRLPEGTRFVVRPDGTVENLDGLPGILQGAGHADLQGPFVFALDCPRAIQFKVRVGTVSAGATLEFQVDGKPVKVFDLPAGQGLERASRFQQEWNIWQTDYDRYFGIEVPAGAHTVQIANSGHDWLQVASVLLEGYASDVLPNLRVLGMACDDRVLVWAQNRSHTWFNVRDKRAIAPVAPTVLTVGGLADGAWRAEIWDTVQGTILSMAAVRAEGGRAQVQLPAIAEDVALKLVRQ